jgi:hypothetical protein
MLHVSVVEEAVSKFFAEESVVVSSVLDNVASLRVAIGRGLEGEAIGDMQTLPDDRTGRGPLSGSELWIPLSGE